MATGIFGVPGVLREYPASFFHLRLFSLVPCHELGHDVEINFAPQGVSHAED